VNETFINGQTDSNDNSKIAKDCVHFYWSEKLHCSLPIVIF